MAWRNKSQSRVTRVGGTKAKRRRNMFVPRVLVQPMIWKKMQCLLRHEYQDNVTRSSTRYNPWMIHGSRRLAKQAGLCMYKPLPGHSSTQIVIAAQYLYSSTLRLANPSLLSLWISIADTSSQKHSPNRRRSCTARASYKDEAPVSCHQQTFQLHPSG